MIKIQLSAQDFIEKKEHTLKADIGEIASIVYFDYYNNQEYSFNTQELFKLIVDYTDNYASGKIIQMRELYNQFDLSTKNKLDRDIARIFIISSRWMHFGDILHFKYKDIFLNTFKDGVDKFLNDINILEWSGNTNIQPGIYFIKKEYITEYKDAIKKFYNLGLLYKYSLKVNGFDNFDDTNYENYIFPFVEDNESNVRKFNLMPYNNIWNKIIQDRNIDIMNFVNGKRNKW
jgi:hypothetical protein